MPPSVNPMTPIVEAAAPVSLDALAVRIRGSSNFRFNWQWFSLEGAHQPSPLAAQLVLADIIEVPANHQFLRASFDAMYDQHFKIEHLHEHCRFRDAGDTFERTLANAAADRLGAYSHLRADAEPHEVDAIRETFGPAAPYVSFWLEPGERSGCTVCSTRNNHLFTNWFYGVAWDWCFCLFAPASRVVCVGCLTDTD